MSQQEDVRRMEERRRQGDRRRDHGHGNSQSNGPDWSARDLENWRRGRAMAWDDFAQVALAHFMENSKDDDERQAAPVVASGYADRMLAERDRRFGA